MKKQLVCGVHLESLPGSIQWHGHKILNFVAYDPSGSFSLKEDVGDIPKELEEAINDDRSLSFTVNKLELSIAVDVIPDVINFLQQMYDAEMKNGNTESNNSIADAGQENTSSS